MISLILAGWAALAAAAISPGPNLVTVASRGLGSGRTAALVVAAGLATGAFLWSFLTAAGLGELFHHFPFLLSLMGWLGGAYLLWLGSRGIRSAFNGAGGQISPMNVSGVRRNFIDGLTVSFTNPKVFFLWASLSTFVGPAVDRISVMLVFSFGSALIVLGVYGGYGLLFSTGRIQALYRQYQAVSEAVFGTVFCGLGVFMICRVS